jgi:hypothetical protein
LNIHHDVASSNQLLIEWVHKRRISVPELAARARKEDVELVGGTRR